jgi:hypothetical protein
MKEDAAMSARGSQSIRDGARGRGALTILDVLIIGVLLALLLAAATNEFSRYEGRSTPPPKAPAAPTQPAPPAPS